MKNLICRQEIAKEFNKIRLKKDYLKKMPQLLYSPPKWQIMVPPLTVNIRYDDFIRDQWYFNGFMLSNNDGITVVDPGVDFYTRLSTINFDIEHIRSVIVSHEDLDHTASLNLLLEKLIRRGVNFKLFIPKTAFKKIILEPIKDKCLAKKVPILFIDQLFKTTDFDNSIKFVRMHHTIKDTFGFKMKINNTMLGYIPDTGYSLKVQTTDGVFEPKMVTGNFVRIVKKCTYIKMFYEDVDFAIVDINDIGYNRHSNFHLSAWDTIALLKNTRVKKVLFQHLSPLNSFKKDNFIYYKSFFKGEKYTTHFSGVKGLKIKLK